MSDYSHTKNLSKIGATASHSKSKHCNNTNKKRNEIKSRTPPLPEGKGSIDEYKKKPYSTRKDLAKLSNFSEGNLDKYKISKLEKKSNDYKNLEYINTSRKRRNIDNENEYFTKKMPVIKDTSPELSGDGAQIDSEDEDNIIEKRRQQRKKLLEELNKKNDKNKSVNDFHINIFTVTKNDTVPDSGTKENKTFKETPDMFSDKDDFADKYKVQHVGHNNEEHHKTLQDNWDDPDGYYNIKLGDTMNNNRYVIKSVLGKGVYANVVKAEDNNQGNNEVAIKIIRHNELMYKTGLKEISILKEIALADPDNKQHCTKLLSYFKHRGHLCLVLEPLYMDLRTVIAKYRKYNGLSLLALVTYTKQLFVALRLLKKIGLIHADIKPDNILVNEKKNILKLCDFGSAIRIHDGTDSTAYLVSRFYRAPEIILGIPYKQSVDIWSSACTMYEMATSKILFTGNSNNNMLKCFMDLKGKFPVKLINKSKYKHKHFSYNNNFLLHKKDELTGKDTVIEMANITIHRNLLKELKKTYKHLSDHEVKKLTQFKDLLDKMLVIDLTQRLNITECLKHPFITEKFKNKD